MPLKKEEDICDKVMGYFGLGDVHPIYVAVPASVVASLVVVSIYRYYMGSSRKSDTKRIQVERQLAQVKNLSALSTWAVVSLSCIHANPADPLFTSYPPFLTHFHPPLITHFLPQHIFLRLWRQ